MTRVPQVGDKATRQPPPPDARVSIRETPDGLGIHNPARRNIVAVLFLSLWLAGWAAGEAFALSELTRGGNIAGLGSLGRDGKGQDGGGQKDLVHGNHLFCLLLMAC